MALKLRVAVDIWGDEPALAHPQKPGEKGVWENRRRPAP